MQGQGTTVGYKSTLARREMLWRKAWQAELSMILSKIIKDLVISFMLTTFTPLPSYSRTLGRWNTRLGKRKGVPVAIKGDVDLNDSLFHKVNMTKG